MESRPESPLNVLGFFISLVAFLMAIWANLPLRLDLPWAALLTLLAAALGALVWHPILVILKRLGLELMALT